MGLGILASCLCVTPEHFGLESFTLWTKMLAIIEIQKARLDKIGFRPVGIECRSAIRHLRNQPASGTLRTYSIFTKTRVLSLVGRKSNRDFGYLPKR